MIRRFVLSSALLLVLCLLLAAAFPAFSQETASRPIVTHEDKHDISPPARDLAGTVPPATGNRFALLSPMRQIPRTAGNLQLADPLVQNLPQPLVNATNLLNFNGISADGFAPPDTNGSVGATQFVQTVNVEYAVYNKTTGARLLGPKPINSIWAGFGGLCESGNQSDPIVLWDKAAQRWFISQVVFNNTSTSFKQCMAVSTTSDATGSYARYAFSFGKNLNDYPKFGVWPDAYYASYNIFQNAKFFAGARACAYDRSAMLAGSAAISICFQRSVNDFSLLPSDLDGNTPPPAGSRNFYVELATSTSLKLFKFHVDFVTPSNSTFTGPSSIPVAAFTQLCPATLACIPQPSPGEKLDAIGDRLMYRNAYRNFGDHEALVLTHTVDKGGGVAGARWYEIRKPSSPVLFQQGTVTGGANIWMASIAMDKNGDIALGFSRSSSTLDPSISYTGRVPSDPLGTMETAKTVVNGTGVQTKTFHRWGDYSSMNIDPADDCTFWYTQEYIKTTGSFTWSTRIVKFKFNSCL